MANGNGSDNGSKTLRERLGGVGQRIRGSEAWESVFRPGSPFRKGYADSPRNRSYVVMNNVMYHLHPVKVKRHGVRLSYTLCLGGLSFFLFIVLTITGTRSVLSNRCVFCNRSRFSSFSVSLSSSTSISIRSTRSLSPTLALVGLVSPRVRYAPYS